MLATSTLTWDLLMDMLINNKTAQPKPRKKGAFFNWANQTPKFLSPTESHYSSSEAELEEDGNLSSEAASEGSLPSSSVVASKVALPVCSHPSSEQPTEKEVLSSLEDRTRRPPTQPKQSSTGTRNKRSISIHQPRSMEDLERKRLNFKSIVSSHSVSSRSNEEPGTPQSRVARSKRGDSSNNCSPNIYASPTPYDDYVTLTSGTGGIQRASTGTHGSQRVLDLSGLRLTSIGQSEQS